MKKFGTQHYRPLPDGLTIASSPINGNGLFTRENLKAGVFLGVTHVWETNRWDWIRTPLGGFINHSEDPNCFINMNIHYHLTNVGVKYFPMHVTKNLFYSYNNQTLLLMNGSIHYCN